MRILKRGTIDSLSENLDEIGITLNTSNTEHSLTCFGINSNFVFIKL